MSSAENLVTKSLKSFVHPFRWFSMVNGQGPLIKQWNGLNGSLRCISHSSLGNEMKGLSLGNINIKGILLILCPTTTKTQFKSDTNFSSSISQTYEIFVFLFLTSLTCFNPWKHQWKMSSLNLNQNSLWRFIMCNIIVIIKKYIFRDALQ